MTDAGTRPSRRRHLLVGAVVALVAIALRLHFVLEVHGHWDSHPLDAVLDGRTGILTPDSFSYLRPARSLLAGDLLGAGNFRRPPGYPAFLALFGTSFLPVLVAQAILGGLLPLCAAALAFVLTGRLALAVLASIPVILSPTGVGLTGLIMSDLLLATCFAVALVLLAAGARQQRRGLVIWAGAIFGAASLVKPVLLLWLPVSILVLWLFAGRRAHFMGRRGLALFAVLQLVPLVGWSARNLAVEHAFTPSSAGSIALREYFAVRTEAWARAGKSPSAKRIHAMQAELRVRFADGEPENAEEMKRYREEALSILRAHPGAAFKVFATNVAESLRDGWTYFERQLPPGAPTRSSALRAAEVEGRLRPFVPWLLGLAIVAAAVARRRQVLLDIVALCLVWGYFVLICATTFWGGTRILYPTQCAVVAAILLGGAALPEAIKRSRRSIDPPAA